MPRFEPTILEAYSLLGPEIVKAALGVHSIDSQRLTPSVAQLLQDVRTCLDEGEDPNQLALRLTLTIQPPDDPDKKVAESLRRLFDNERLDVTRVLCVTTEVDNIGLWENYADKHTGLALGLRHIETESTPLLAATPVVYSDSPPVVGSGLDYLLYGHCQDLEKRTRLAITCTKTTKWSYEREWRGITYRPQEVGQKYKDYLILPDELESVTLGLNASVELEEEVLALTNSKYPRCTVFRMQTENGKLSRQPVSTGPIQP